MGMITVFSGCLPINLQEADKTEASTTFSFQLLGASEYVIIKRPLTTTNQTAAQAACEHSVLCSECCSPCVQQCPLDRCSRVDTTAALRRQCRRRRTTYCTSPLHRTHTHTHTHTSSCYKYKYKWEFVERGLQIVQGR